MHSPELEYDLHMAVWLWKKPQNSKAKRFMSVAYALQLTFAILTFASILTGLVDHVQMDPVASGLTILNTVRKAISTAKKLYDAPKELEELQVEVETFTSVLNDIVVSTFDLRTVSNCVDVAISSTQSCLLEIRQLIEYELVNDAPDGKKARRCAWLRKVKDVHDLLEKLGECRANLILAFTAERRSDSLFIIVLCLIWLRLTEGCSEATLKHLQYTVQQKSEDLQRSFDEHATDARLHQGLVLEKLERYEQRWESHKRYLELHQQEYRRLGQMLEDLMIQGRQVRTTDPFNRTANRRLLLPGAPGSEPSVNDLSIQAEYAEPFATASISRFPAEQVRSLMSTCGCSHSICESRGSMSQLPTRVLDVGDECLEVRLHEPRGFECDRYAALSYCWGDACSIITSQSTLEIRKRSISWDIIPPLFRDAIVVTRKLGIRFLWIDALCIIQDDVEDWEKESGTMARVFGNATLTIAADCTPHPSSHLLLPVPANRGDPKRFVQAVFDNAVSRSPATPYNLMKEFSSSGYWNRAWTMQETILSRATLHFVAGTILFECLTGITPLLRERGTDQLVTLPHPENHMKKLCSPTWMNASSMTEILGVWWRVVEHYSTRKLGFQSDKLVAISGVAERFASYLGSYAAGLWLQPDLVRSLCWRARSTSYRHATYTAPSWS